MKNLFFAFFACLLIAISSCGKDDVSPSRCDATLFNEDINPKLAAWQEAINNYAADQSEANCNAYKTTGNAWLESIRSYSDCATLYTESWKEAVDEAQAELAAQTCD